MNTTDCYRILGLSTQASLTEVKAAYRRLARQYHPDTNPHDHRAQEKFIRITEAYKFLLSVVRTPSPPPVAVQSPSRPPTAADRPPPPSPAAAPSASASSAAQGTDGRGTPPLSAIDQQLKTISYQQLRELLKYQRFPRAVALVEGLSQRLPQDPEVRQWQAITYQRWGRHLIGEKQLDKARIYLRKALQTDPHNKSLWAEVERDFRRLEKVF